MDVTLRKRKIRGILFDLGGVLIEHPVARIIDYCARYLGVDPERLLELHQRHGSDFQTGRGSEAVYWQGVCAELGVPVPCAASLWGEAFAYAYREHEEVFALATALHNRGYRVGLLSDTEKPSVDFFLSRCYNYFDALTFSCLEGTVKPDPEIYRIALERLGTAPAETVFIDDKPENIEGAIHVGMHAVLFKSFEQVRQALKDLGVAAD